MLQRDITPPVELHILRKNLKKNTNCPNEQVVALLSVIASNYAITTEKKEN